MGAHVYSQPGVYHPNVSVLDDGGQMALGTAVVTVSGSGSGSGTLTGFMSGLLPLVEGLYGAGVAAQFSNSNGDFNPADYQAVAQFGAGANTPSPRTTTTSNRPPTPRPSIGATAAGAAAPKAPTPRGRRTTRPGRSPRSPTPTAAPPRTATTPPATASPAEQHPRCRREAGLCRTFALAGTADLAVGLGDTWDAVQARLPAAWRPDFVALDLHYTAVPAALWSAPLPVVGLAADWNLL